MVWSIPNIKNFKHNTSHTIQKHVKLIPDYMTILMERPAPAGLMWKTDWVPDETLSTLPYDSSFIMSLSQLSPIYVCLWDCSEL